jgi:SAM-dependent methyltransferase
MSRNALPDQYEIDRRSTIENRARLIRNRNLLYWYEQLYRHQFAGLGTVGMMRVLEIGSGTSPLKRFYPSVLTSDVLRLDYLDFVFDCHDIESFSAIPAGSLDVITLTNVLHHLRDPIAFLAGAATKLRPHGRVIATEPYFSAMSTLIWRFLHHEPVDFAIQEPRLAKVMGPLASANIALPFLIFGPRKEWASRLEAHYRTVTIQPFTALAYMATGGISRRFPIPGVLYRPFFAIDRILADWAPAVFASFFTVVLTRHDGSAPVAG